MTNNENEGATSAKATPSKKSSSDKNITTETSAQSTTGRYRNFVTLIYPESAPPDWLDKLRALHVPAFVSPIHDKDVEVNKETGIIEPKKPHYHILLMFDGVKTFKQVQSLIETFGGVGCKNAQSLRGYARYLCHYDNPEKAKYSRVDVVEICGADYDAITHMPVDDMTVLSEMMDFIRLNQVKYFSVFADYCRTYNQEWFKAIITRFSYFIKEYIKSLSFEQNNEMQPSNLETLHQNYMNNKQK